MYAVVNAQLRLDELTQNRTHIRVCLLFTNHALPLLNAELPNLEPSLRAPLLIAEPAWRGNRQRWPLAPLGAPPQGRCARPSVAQRTTMAQLWWPRSSNCATCPTTREADSTAATGLRSTGILSRAPQPCALFTITSTNLSSASSNLPSLTD